jgi:hypothetical protein
MPDEPLTISVKQAAALLGNKKDNVMKAFQSGRIKGYHIPYKKKGKRLRLYFDSVCAYKFTRTPQSVLEQTVNRAAPKDRRRVSDLLRLHYGLPSARYTRSRFPPYQKVLSGEDVIQRLTPLLLRKHLLQGFSRRSRP